MDIKLLKISSLNIFFRVLTLGAKLLLSFFLIKYISTEEFGAYGIITKTLTIAMVLLGLDFYTYSSRDILQGDIILQGDKIKDQFSFYLLSYVVFLPLLAFVFVFDIIAWEYFIWFYLLLVLDHFSQELYRVLLVFKKPVAASALFFIKVGLWILPLFALWMLGKNEFMNLKSVLIFWTAFEVIAILFGLFFFLKLPFSLDFKKPVNWSWIKSGLIVSMPFFLGTIASNVIEFADLYMIKAYFGAQGDYQYGIYSFFVGMGNIVQMFVQSAILIVFAPKLLESFNQDKKQYKKLHKEMSIQNIAASLLMAVGVFLFLMPLVKFIGKTEIVENYNLIFFLVGAKVLFNFSMIYHYHLYASKNDKSIVATMVIAAIINIALNIFWIPMYGIYGAAAATFVSFLVIFVLKFIFAKRLQIFN